MSTRFSGQVAVVTGAASPLGMAIARRLSREGATLALFDIDESAAPRLRDAIGPEALFLAGDLSDGDIARNLFDEALRTHGRIDILVNNAGGGVIRPFRDHSARSLLETIDRNLWTCLWCCKAVYPILVRQEYGRIVNIGADSVRNGLWMHAAYNAAKGGVHGLTTGLARELSPFDITVNTVAPCIVATPAVIEALESSHAADVRAMIDVIPKGRPASPEEVASIVAYLASSEAGFITGQVISVNGGSTMQ